MTHRNDAASIVGPDHGIRMHGMCVLTIHSQKIVLGIHGEAPPIGRRSLVKDHFVKTGLVQRVAVTVLVSTEIDGLTAVQGQQAFSGDDGAYGGRCIGRSDMQIGPPGAVGNTAQIHRTEYGCDRDQPSQSETGHTKNKGAHDHTGHASRDWAARQSVTCGFQTGADGQSQTQAENASQDKFACHGPKEEKKSDTAAKAGQKTGPGRTLRGLDRVLRGIAHSRH